MFSCKKRILIIDEYGFSRICSAILEVEGYSTETISNIDNLPLRLKNNDFGLILISYPYGNYLLDEIKKWNISTIILSDNLNEELIVLLKSFVKSYCMIKPLDYDKFKILIKQVMNTDFNVCSGFSII